MAHMDRMIILHVWGKRERRILKRTREQISNKTPGEPIDAMRQWGKNDFWSFFTLVRGRGVDV